MEGHHEKAEIVNPHGRNGGFHQIRLRVEYMDEKDRKQMQKAPDYDGITDTAYGHETDGGTDAVALACPVIIADDGLRTVGDAGYGHGDDLTDRIDDRHNPYIQIPAVGGERGIAYYLHDAVGDGHHEAG